jgi:hypothetical protein
MRTLKPGWSALMLSLVLASASAQEPAATAQVPEYRPVPRSQTEPYASQVIPNPPRKPIRRRSVQQAIDPTPRIAADSYRPTLEPRPPAATQTLAVPGPASTPASGPVLLNSCDAGGCYDTSGARYNGAGGNTLIGPQGQLCTKGAVNAQCN